MALILQGCSSEVCDGLTYTDTTGPYSVGNPNGYGPENDVNGPSDFATMVFSFWAPGVDPNTTAATATINLLTNVPTPDAEGHYEWPTFTFAELGVTSIESGVGYIEVVAVDDEGDTYSVNFQPIFTKQLYDALKPKMAAWRPDGCKKTGCLSVTTLWNALQTVMCGGVCSAEQAADIIRWIKANMKQICC